jgi:hypothetical protein
VKRRWWLAAVLVVVAVGVILAVFLRFRQAPLPARILPDSAEAYVYVDIRPVRSFVQLGPGKLIQDPEVIGFTAETGISPERDLEEFALAVLPPEKTSTGEPERRFAETFAANYDMPRLERFLRTHAKTVDRYGDYDIFVIPREERTVRVTLLDPRLIAASNANSPDAIHAIIDRFTRRGGHTPALLRRNYDHVPVGAIGWAIIRMNQDSQHGMLPLPDGSVLSLPHDTEVIASVRVLSSLELRAEARCASEQEAKKLTESIQTYLALFNTIQLSMGTKGPDADAKQLFDNLRVEQDGKAVRATAGVPISFLAKMMASDSSSTRH